MRFINRLSARLVINFVVVNIVLMVIVAIGSISVIDHEYRSHFVRQSQNSANQLAQVFQQLARSSHPLSTSQAVKETIPNLINSLDTLNRDVMKSAMDHLLSEGEIVYIDLVQLQQGAEKIVVQGEPFTGTNFIYSTDESFGRGIDPVFYTQVQLASTAETYLRVGFDERPTTNAIHAMYRNVFIVALIYIFGGILMMYALTTSLLRPLKALGVAARRLSEGNYHRGLTVNSRKIDEISGLAEDIEAMRCELGSKASELAHVALHDNLTTLPNRTLLNDRLKQETLKIGYNVRPFGLLLLDLVNFKNVNDSLGQLAGDLLLQETAARLVATVKDIDTVARVGADEFAIFLHDTDREAALSVAEAVRDMISLPYNVLGHEVHVGSSTGISLFPEHGEEYTQLLKQANAAMQESKRKQVDIVMYQASHDQDGFFKLQLANELRESLKDGDIEVYYQPKLSLHDGSLVGFEALVRWAHSTRGVIPPDQFIAIAKKAGLIQELTLSVIHRALKELKCWQAINKDLSVAINLSAVNLADDTLAKKIIDVMGKSGIPFNTLELELTETAILSEPESSIAILKQLNESGIQIAIDDFGTGYSSLSYLKTLPVNCLKIDRSFVLDMSNDDNDCAIVKATIEMAHSLGLKVVAEGIESPLALEALGDLDCDMGQGYFISAPMSAEDCYQFVLKSFGQEQLSNDSAQLALALDGEF